MVASQLVLIFSRFDLHFVRAWWFTMDYGGNCCNGEFMVSTTFFFHHCKCVVCLVKLGNVLVASHESRIPFNHVTLYLATCISIEQRSTTEGTRNVLLEIKGFWHLWFLYVFMGVKWTLNGVARHQPLYFVDVCLVICHMLVGHGPQQTQASPWVMAEWGFLELHGHHDRRSGGTCISSYGQKYLDWSIEILEGLETLDSRTLTLGLSLIV